jgi:hypothetical protein
MVRKVRKQAYRAGFALYTDLDQSDFPPGYRAEKSGSKTNHVNLITNGVRGCQVFLAEPQESLRKMPSGQADLRKTA